MLKKILIVVIITSIIAISCNNKTETSSFKFRNELGDFYIKMVDFPASATI